MTSSSSSPQLENDLAAALDDATTEASTNSSSNSDEEPTTISGILSFLHRRTDGEGKRHIKDSLQIMKDHDGSHKKGDVTMPTKEEALTSLKEMIENELQSKNSKPEKRSKWQFAASPHEQFGKTLDDTFLAFIVWARVQSDDENDESLNKANELYNVSKAFRRLEAYAEWMEESKDELSHQPLTADSVKTAIEIWAMQCSINKTGHLVWWIDLGQIDKDAVKTIDVADHVRVFCWMSHLFMYHPQAQANGIMFCENVNEMGFMAAISLMPMKLKNKLNKLTIGSLPIKMKKLYILGIPTWMGIWMKFISVFLTKKMKERFVMLYDWQKLEEIMGPECIPKGFGKLEGSLEHDLVHQTYFS